VKKRLCAIIKRHKVLCIFGGREIKPNFVEMTQAYERVIVTLANCPMPLLDTVFNDGKIGESPVGALHGNA